MGYNNKFELMSLYSTPLTAPFNSDLVFSQQLLKELENDKQLVDRIRRERLRAQQLKQGLQKKQAQIHKISTQNKQLSKLRPYYDKFNVMKQMLDEALSKLEIREKENIKLSDELERVMIELETSHKKLTESDRNRLYLMKERAQLERINSEIEETFLQYKNQCKGNEGKLVERLERAQRQVKDEKKLIDQLDETRRELNQLKRRAEDLQRSNKQLQEQKTNLLEIITLKEKELIQMKKQESHQQSKQAEISNYQLSIQNQQLRRSLFQKEKDLEKSRRFNHELSIQYDSSVNKNLEFERQLYEYRRQNHELKKQLSLFIEKEEYEKYYKKEMMDQSLESEDIDQLSSKHM